MDKESYYTEFETIAESLDELIRSEIKTLIAQQRDRNLFELLDGLLKSNTIDAKRYDDLITDFFWSFCH